MKPEEKIELLAELLVWTAAEGKRADECVHDNNSYPYHNMDFRAELDAFIHYLKREPS